jgi:hypothetical protein
MDKLIPLFQKRGDVTEPKEGRDLTLILKAVPTPNGNGTYTSVSTIMADDKGSLNSNEGTSTEWLSNTEEWRDVYSQKPIEYLEAISKGETPEWDSNLGKYVYGSSESVDMGTKTTSTDPQANQTTDEDLPF